MQIDYIKMLVTLPQEKVDYIALIAKSLLLKTHDTIRNVAKVIGTIVASFPAVQMGPLHYRILEAHKAVALKVNSGNFDAIMEVTHEMKRELKWWGDNISLQGILRKNPQITLTSDASLEGWGCTCLNEKTVGRWNEHESCHHINYLELLGAFFALQSFADKVCNKSVQLLLDNTTAVSYINNMGGKQPQLNALASDIWHWCLKRQIWLSSSHIPGVCNMGTDFESRHFKEGCEWSLLDSIFCK